MPVYEYRCKQCEHQFELRQSFTEPPLTTCPQCGGSVHKVFHPAPIIFKGSGWYITDNRKNGTSNGTSSRDTAKKEEKSEAATSSPTKDKPEPTGHSTS